MSPDAGPALSPEFLQELEVARRRVDVLEEANRAIQGLVNRISRLSAFSEGLEGSGSPEEVADLLFEEVRGIFPVDLLVLSLAPETGARFAPFRTSCPPAAAEDARREFEAQAGLGMLRWALELRRPTMVAAQRLGGHLVLVPLVTAQRVVGVLLVGTSVAAEAIEHGQLTLAAVAARQAAECLDNLRLTEELRRRNAALQQAAETAQARRVADLGLLVESARTVSGPLDPDSILQMLAEVTCRHLEVPTVSIALLDGDGCLRVAASTGLAPECLDCVDHLGQEGGLSGWVAEHCQPLLARDIWADPRNRCCEVARDAGYRSYLGVPMVARERTIGVLSVMTDRLRDFSPEEVALLSGLAAQGALAIENARLHGEALRRSDELGALLRAAKSVMANLGLEQILRRIVEEAALISGTPHVTVLLVDRDEPVLRLGAVAGRPASLLEGFRLPVGTGYSGVVAETGQPLSVADCRNDSRNTFAEQDRALGLVSYLGLPIRVRETVVGVLTFNTDGPRTYTVEELAYLTSFADQAAVAIENARLVEDLQHRVVEQQRAMARLVQTTRMASVGLLAAGVAHDINNPLCVISNHLQLLRLRHPALAAPLEAALQSVEANVQRIAGRIQALLEYARAKPGERGRCDVNESIERLLGLLQSHPLYRRLQISAAYGGDLPPVELDRVAWEQVLQELLSNAREAMPAGGSVWITTRRLGWADAGNARQGGAGEAGEAAASSAPHHPTTPPLHQSPGPLGPGDWVEVIIRDDGPGIAPQHLQRIFDPFFTTKGTPGGMGLGLTVARDLVAEQGGDCGCRAMAGEAPRSSSSCRLPSLPRPSPPRRRQRWRSSMRTDLLFPRPLKAAC